MAFLVGEVEGQIASVDVGALDVAAAALTHPLCLSCLLGVTLPAHLEVVGLPGYHFHVCPALPRAGDGGGFLGGDGAILVPGEILHRGQLTHRQPVPAVAVGCAGDAGGVILGHLHIETQRRQALVGSLRPGHQDVGQGGERLDQVGVGTLGTAVGLQGRSGVEACPQAGPVPLGAGTLDGQPQGSTCGVHLDGHIQFGDFGQATGDVALGQVVDIAPPVLPTAHAQRVLEGFDHLAGQLDGVASLEGAGERGGNLLPVRVDTEGDQEGSVHPDVILRPEQLGQLQPGDYLVVTLDVLGGLGVDVPELPGENRHQEAAVVVAVPEELRRQFEHHVLALDALGGGQFVLC